MRSHEIIYMFTKRKRYYYDCEAIEEPATSAPCPVKKPGCKYGSLKLLPPIGNKKHKALGKANLVGNQIAPRKTRNKRDVWTIATEPHRDSHVAMFPSELPRLCIKAGSRPGDLVLDPFAGSGTTGLVAKELGRNAVLLDISAKYVQEMRERLEGKKHDKSGTAKVGVDSGDPLRHPGLPPGCADRGVGIVPPPRGLPTPAGGCLGASLQPCGGHGRRQRAAGEEKPECIQTARLRG